MLKPAVDLAYVRAQETATKFEKYSTYVLYRIPYNWLLREIDKKITVHEKRK